MKNTLSFSVKAEIAAVPTVFITIPAANDDPKIAIAADMAKIAAVNGSYVGVDSCAEVTETILFVIKKAKNTKIICNTAKLV